MRSLLTSVFLVLSLTACPEPAAYTGPPVDRFYYPTGLVHVDRPGLEEGVLFVANANFDKRYSTGSVTAVRLDALGLPRFGAAGGALPTIGDLKVRQASVVQVASFTGELAALETSADGLRLFVPSRSEGDTFQAIDARFETDGQVTLSCVLPPGASADASRTDCTATAPSLTKFEFDEGGLPRASVPFGVATRPRACQVADDCLTPGLDVARACVGGICRATDGDVFGDVWVTHLTQVDTPLGSGSDQRAYAVRLDSDRLEVTKDSYVDLGGGGGSSVALGARWAYVSGRLVASGVPAQMVRLVDRAGLVWHEGLEAGFRVAEGRGIALSSDEKRVYLAGHLPDSLLVLSVTGAETASPSLAVVRAVPLPDGANEVRVIPRPGRSDLVAVTCTTGGVLALYDDDVGDLVAQVQGVGLQSFGLAVASRPPGARLFVGNFSDGRVAVIDIDDLDRPQGARIVAWLGASQLCLTRGAEAANCDTGVTP